MNRYTFLTLVTEACRFGVRNKIVYNDDKDLERNITGNQTKELNSQAIMRITFLDLLIPTFKIVVSILLIVNSYLILLCNLYYPLASGYNRRGTILLCN